MALTKAESAALYRARHSDRVAAYLASDKAKANSARRQAEYRKRHPERVAAYAEKNADKFNEKARERYKLNGGHPSITAGTDAYKKYRASEKYQRTYFNNHLKRKYGISYDDYMVFLENQNGVCKICGGKDTRKWKNGRTQRMTLFVDHDHETLKVRGLLCNKCNVGIAMFNDSKELLMRAINYLKE